MEILRALAELIPEIVIAYWAIGALFGGLVISAIISPHGGHRYIVEDIQTGRRYKIW